MFHANPCRVTKASVLRVVFSSDTYIFGRELFRRNYSNININVERNLHQTKFPSWKPLTIKMRNVHVT